MLQRFYRDLAMLSALGLLLTLVLNQLDLFQSAAKLSLLSLGFFILLTWIIFLLGKRAVVSRNPNSLTQVILGIFMLKLVSCAAIVVGYKRLADPPDNWFVVPFLLLYVLFTTFEVRLFNQLNRKDASQRKAN